MVGLIIGKDVIICPKCCIGHLNIKATLFPGASP